MMIEAKAASFRIIDKHFPSIQTNSPLIHPLDEIVVEKGGAVRFKKRQFSSANKQSERKRKRTVFFSSE
jgi:hypothetical protein